MLNVKYIISLIKDETDKTRAEKVYAENKNYFETILNENYDLTDEEIIDILIDELTKINLEDFYESKN